MSINPTSLIVQASNIVTDDNNPLYTQADFESIYPQFVGLVPGIVLEQFIAMGNATVLQSRWHTYWLMGMSNFVAHFATLYLQTATGLNPTAQQVIGAAQSRGLITSKSVGSVSVGQDFSQTLGNITGWAAFKSTQFGVNFISTAKLLGKAGSYIW